MNVEARSRPPGRLSDSRTWDRVHELRERIHAHEESWIEFSDNRSHSRVSASRGERSVSHLTITNWCARPSRGTRGSRCAYRGRSTMRCVVQQYCSNVRSKKLSTVTVEHLFGGRGSLMLGPLTADICCSVPKERPDQRRKC